MENLNVPDFIKKIDWSELRNQKSALVKHIADLRNDSSEVNQIQAKNELADYLEGILSLIDAVQDYAVDVAEIAKEIDVYDFELEDEREMDSNETKTLWLCPHCGSDNIELKMWVNANTNQLSDEAEVSISPEDYWCNDCERHFEEPTMMFENDPRD